MKILALAAERNCGIFYWAFIDIRSRRVESSEEGVLNVLRNRPELVADARDCRSETNRFLTQKSISPARFALHGEGEAGASGVLTATLASGTG